MTKILIDKNTGEEWQMSVCPTVDGVEWAIGRKVVATNPIPPLQAADAVHFYSDYAHPKSYWLIYAGYTDSTPQFYSTDGIYLRIEGSPKIEPKNVIEIYRHGKLLWKKEENGD